MKPNLPTYSREQAAIGLAWLMDMGADEIISEAAVDRFGLTMAAAQQRPAETPIAKRVVPPVAAQPISQAGPIDTATLVNEAHSIGALVDILNSITGSSLKKSASNLCFISHQPDAKIMVIGDKPGKDEDISGEVFAGKNHVLLERMLAAIGLGLDQVTLVNFIPWRPPGNRNVTEAEIAFSQPFVARAVALARPRLILTLGQLPAMRLTGNDQVLAKLRGQWQNYALADGSEIPMLASLHPEFLLKQPLQKKLAWRDLLTFKARLGDV
jgi:uracil-DNA glycosylase